MAHGLGPRAGQRWLKKAIPIPLVAVPPREPQTENKKIFFSISTRRHAESVEGLNSSLALAAGDS